MPAEFKMQLCMICAILTAIWIQAILSICERCCEIARSNYRETSFLTNKCNAFEGIINDRLIRLSDEKYLM